MCPSSTSFSLHLSSRVRASGVVPCLSCAQNVHTRSVVADTAWVTDRRPWSLRHCHRCVVWCVDGVSCPGPHSLPRLLDLGPVTATPHFGRTTPVSVKPVCILLVPRPFRRRPVRGSSRLQSQSFCSGYKCRRNKCCRFSTFGGSQVAPCLPLRFTPGGCAALS